MNEKTLFIAVPKTGTMSVITALLPHGLHAVKYDVGKVSRTFDPERPLTTFYHASVQSLVEAKLITHEWLQQRNLFAVLRNPWDRMVSLYHYLCGVLQDRHGKKTFPEFVVAMTQQQQQPIGPYNWCGLSQAQPQAAWIESSAGVKVEVYCFEDLASEWVRMQLLVGVEADLPHLAASHRHKDYREYYTPLLRDLVGEFYEKDVKLGGYTYD